MVDRLLLLFIICCLFSFLCFEKVSDDGCYFLTDYETLRALDADNVPTASSMSEEEINALPIHKYKVSSAQRYRS